MPLDRGRARHQALARRRLNALWALIRDGRTFQTTPPPRTARVL
ncbi:hypothetical protein [Streptomyces sichuanensis]|nr:hypothetical protein [Streptomyces sichuanensis]